MRIVIITGASSGSPALIYAVKLFELAYHLIENLVRCVIRRKALFLVFDSGCRAVVQPTKFNELINRGGGLTAFPTSDSAFAYVRRSATSFWVYPAFTRAVASEILELVIICNLILQH